MSWSIVRSPCCAQPRRQDEPSRIPEPGSSGCQRQGGGLADIPSERIRILAVGPGGRRIDIPAYAGGNTQVLPDFPVILDEGGELADHRAIRNTLCDLSAIGLVGEHLLS